MLMTREHIFYILWSLISKGAISLCHKILTTENNTFKRKEKKRINCLISIILVRKSKRLSILNSVPSEKCIDLTKMIFNSDRSEERIGFNVLH